MENTNIIDAPKVKATTNLESNTILRILSIVYGFFLSCYSKVEEAAIQCKTSCSNLWGKEFCTNVELGYSPADFQSFQSYLNKKNISKEKAYSIDQIDRLYNGDKDSSVDYYIFSEGYVIIPQKDENGKLTALVAYGIKDQKLSRKHFTIGNNIISHKRCSLFGIDQANMSIREQGKVYIAKDPADVLSLQSIGIKNVVSISDSEISAGEQIAFFDIDNLKVCFIVDNEDSVSKNAMSAIKTGFNVSIKKSKRISQDDLYVKPFLTKYEFDNETEISYCQWFAQNEFSSSEDDLTKVEKICEVISWLPEHQQRYELDCMKKNYKQVSVKVWKETLKKQSDKRLKEKKSEVIADKIEGYDFYSKDGYYYVLKGTGDREKEKILTNFLYKSIALVTDGNGKAKRIFTIKNTEGKQETIEIDTNVITDLKKFKECIEAKGNFHIYADNTEYECLKDYFYADEKVAYFVKQMGFNMLNDVEFYSWANGFVYQGHWISVDQYGLISLTSELNIYLPATTLMHRNEKVKYQNDLRFIHNSGCPFTPIQFFNEMILHFGDNAKVSIAFFLSTLFRDIIFEITGNFPLLFLFGQKDTGKTNHAKLLSKLVQTKEELTSLPSASKYAIGDKIQQVSNFIVILDEYKDDIGEDKIGILKNVYNGVGRTKKSDNDEHREETSVDCGVIVAGQEMPTRDDALFERCIFVEHKEKSYSKERNNAFTTFCEKCSSGLTPITVFLVNYRPYFVENWKQCYRNVRNQLKDKLSDIGSERLYNEWSILLATIECCEKAELELPFDFNSFLETVIKFLSIQAKKCNNTNPVSEFWKAIFTAVQSNFLIEGVDYKIIKLSKLAVEKTDKKCEDIVFEKDTKLLCLCSDKAISVLYKIQRQEGINATPKNTLLSLLEHSSEYIGKSKNAMFFKKVDRNGNDVEEPVYKSGSCVSKKKGNRVRADIFYYDKIKQNYGVDLEYIFIDEESENDLQMMENGAHSPDEISDNEESELPF